MLGCLCDLRMRAESVHMLHPFHFSSHLAPLREQNLVKSTCF